MCLFFLLKVLFEFVDPALQITVDLDVSSNDAFHAAYIFVYVVFNGSDTLDV